MDLSNNKRKFVYNKEQLCAIRDNFIKNGGLNRIKVPPSVVSADADIRLPYRRSKPIVDPNLRHPKTAENSFVGGDGSGDSSHHSAWKRARRASGGVPQSPLDASYNGPQRHHSGSSGGEDVPNSIGAPFDGTNGGVAVRRSDWTLGCGKWRHRSTSGSERGGLKGGFFAGGGRGRGRGGSAGGGPVTNDANGGAAVFGTSPINRGRGFMRRPFAPGRGGAGGRGGLKSGVSFANHQVPDHGPTEEDFEPQDEEFALQNHPYPSKRHHHSDTYAEGNTPSFRKNSGGSVGSGGGGGGNSSTDDRYHQRQHEAAAANAERGSPSAPKSVEQHSSTNLMETPLAPPVGFPNVVQSIPPGSPMMPTGGGDEVPPRPEGVLDPPCAPFLNTASFGEPFSTQSDPTPTTAAGGGGKSTLWYYRDLNGKEHGPFDNELMGRWFAVGYFPVHIQVRRECDKVFSRISDFILLLGRFPFVDAGSLPPILKPLPPLQPPALQQQQPAPPPSQPPSLPPIPQAPQMQPMDLLQSIAASMAATPPPPPQPMVNPSLQWFYSNQRQEFYNSHVGNEFPTMSSNSGGSNSLEELTKASLAHLLLMQQQPQQQPQPDVVAQELTERFSAALGIDQALLAKALAALSLGAGGPPNPLMSPSVPPPQPQQQQQQQRPPTPPNVINLEQLEAAIHERQRQQEALEEEEERRRKQQQQQQQQQENETTAAAATISVVQEGVRQSTTPPPSAPVVAEKKPGAENQRQQESSSSQVEETEKAPTTSTTTSGQTSSKKKKKKRAAKATASSSAAEETPVEPVNVNTTAALEPEDDWVAIPVSGPTSYHATKQTLAAHQEQEQQPQETNAKKSKKKKKAKLTASELQQRAWEAEERRRRAANLERIARREAEEAAARAEEEAAASAIAAASSAGANTRQAAAAAVAAARRREVAMREAAAASLAQLKLPPTARWASAAATGSNTPHATAQPSMADILAAQMQEEEYARASRPSGGATFASKLAGGLPNRPTTAAAVAAAAVSANGPQMAAGAAAPPVKAPTSAQPKPTTAASLAAKKQMASKSMGGGAAAVNKTPVLSIWDLPADPNAISKPAKKANKKKKPNASTHLLTGSLITLAPKAKAELVRWCEGQLSGFPRHNVDIPTLISLLCDIEEAEEVLECIESSFGKSARVSSFSKAFVEKRAHLMGATA